MEAEQRFTKLFSFCFVKAMEIVSLFINIKVLGKRSFEDFLNLFKHDMFHQWIPGVPCCQCQDDKDKFLYPRNAFVEYQMASMYDLYGQINSNHELKRKNGDISQHCICKIVAIPGVKTIDIDIGTVYCLLKTCDTSVFASVVKELEAIRKIRNNLAHSNGKLTELSFNTKWNELEDAVISIANKISPSHKDYVIRQIKALKLKEITITRDEFMEGINKIKEDYEKLLEERLKTMKQQLKKQLAEHSENMSCVVKNVIFDIIKKNGKPSPTDEQQSRSWKCCVCLSSYEPRRTVLIIWTIEPPLNWDVENIKESLLNHSPKSESFDIEFVRNGSLIIGARLPRQIVESQEQLNLTTYSFFTQMVEVCKIDVDTPAVISIRYTVDENPEYVSYTDHTDDEHLDERGASGYSTEYYVDRKDKNKLGEEYPK